VSGEIARLLSGGGVQRQPGTPRTLLDEFLDQPGAIPTSIADRALGTTLLGSIPAMGGAWCWLLYRLGNHPDMLARIRAEVTNAKSEIPWREPDQVLPYTKAFVHETLRVHPPAWLLGRDTTTSVTLGDHAVVPAGTAVLFSPYLLHHDPRWWRDPEQFDPNRWLQPKPPHAPHAYLPFGAGPRVCLGAYLGLMILVLTAAHIATCFQLHITAPHPVIARYGSVMLPIGLSCQLALHDAAHASTDGA
jgi:unspecific monooxygenase